MDTKIIGWTLVFVLIALFFKYNEKSFSPTDKEKNAVATEKVVPRFEKLRDLRRDKLAEHSFSLVEIKNSTPDLLDNDNEIFLENAKIKVCFSTTGGTIEKVILKEYRSYGGGELVLCDADSIVENFNIKIKNALENSDDVPKDCDVCLLPFFVKKAFINGKNAIEFFYEANSCSDNGCKFIIKKIFYFDDISPYVLQHDIEIEDVNDEIASVQYQLNDLVKKQEKNLKDCQMHTSIKYLNAEDESKHELSAFSSSEQQECKKVRWVNIMQKFFSLSIFSEEGLNNVRVNLSTPSIDGVVKKVEKPAAVREGEEGVRIRIVPDGARNIVKEASVFFDVEKSFQKTGNNKFCKKIKYYFGPNDVCAMKSLGNKLEESIYLGWPGARHIGKYLYLPFIKKMEEKHIPAWLLVIILILLLKLLFSIFLFKGYLGMLKLKFLNPYFEELQRKHGDDFFAIAEDRRKITSKVNVNMLSFLLVNLMQLPFWNSIYYVFQCSMFFRQKSFLWCDDMSTYDSVLNFKINVPLFGDHVSLFALLMLAMILVQIIFSQGGLSFSRGKVVFVVAIALFFLVINNNMCVCFTFYFFISSLLTTILQKCIDFFVDQEKIKAEIDSILIKEGFTKKIILING